MIDYIFTNIASSRLHAIVKLNIKEPKYSSSYNYFVNFKEFNFFETFNRLSDVALMKSKLSEEKSFELNFEQFFGSLQFLVFLHARIFRCIFHQQLYCTTTT